VTGDFLSGSLVNLIEKDLLLVNALSVVLLLSILLMPETPLRIILGVPFILFFPGYTLTSAMFPKKTDLGGIERLTLSISLSLALVPLIGLVLNYTAWGIRLYPIIASIFVLTLLLSIASNYRRARLPLEEKYSFFDRLKLPKTGTKSMTDKLLITSVLIAIIAVASVVVYIASAPKVGEHFTEFYLLGSNGKLADYPVNLTLADNCTIILGITNHEYGNMTYKIAVLFDNQTIETINNVKLGHDENWSQNYTFAPKAVSDKTKLDFQLYKEGVDEPYRDLYLWVTVKAKL
jgi:uncharacterized membrane protein